jgi:hypothetical protein
MRTAAAPCLSLILTATGGLGGALACLATVARQARDREIEILLAYSSDRDAPEGLVADCPGVVLIRLPAAATLPQLLGTAIARAQGEIIAITDATCAVGEGWVPAILRAHEAPHPIVGGAVEPDGLKNRVDWAAYFCDYGQFMLPLVEGVVREVPGNNLSIKRAMLTKGRAFVEREFWKTYWCREMQAEGVSLHADPAIVVSYRKSFGLRRYLVHRFQNGRCFAGMRNAQLGALKRVAYAAGSPLLPILLALRVLRVVLPNGRHRRPFFLSLPLIALAVVSWALGECCGYLLGPGTSCRHVR